MGKLHIAACQGLFPEAEKLLKGSILSPAKNVNDKDKYGRTPLMYAASNGNLDMIRYLIDEWGATIDEKNSQDYGLTAFWYALIVGNIDVMRFLHEKGANVNVKITMQESRAHHKIIISPLHFAARLFSENPIDTDCERFFLISALYPFIDHIQDAIRSLSENNVHNRFLNPEIVGLLLLWGADPTAKIYLENATSAHKYDKYLDKESNVYEGKTPLEIARYQYDIKVEAGQKEIAKVFKQAIDLLLKSNQISNTTSTTNASVVTATAAQLLNEAGKISIELNIPSKKLVLGKEVGRGGFGVVYHAIMDHQDVAVKQLHYKLAHDTFNEFKKETAIMARLRNPNIVQLYGVCIEEGKPLRIIMEYMQNGSLFHFLHSTAPVPLPLCVSIALDMSLGLHYLHESDVLHRDIKSYNVLLDKDFNAKLNDFGLSKVKKEASSTSAAHHSPVGTNRWLAPELISKDPKYSSQSDVFALAITFWEIFSRKLPFEEADNSVVPTLVRSGEREAIPTHCPVDFSKLIKRCWAQNASDRPSLDAVIIDLKKIRVNVNSVAASSGTYAPAQIPRLQLNNLNSQLSNKSTSNYLSNGK